MFAFSALFILPPIDAALVGNGLPPLLVSWYSSLVTCSAATTLPTTNIKGGVSLLLHGGSTVYAFGGKLSAGGVGTEACWKYDMGTGTWSTIASLVQARYDSQTIELNDDDAIIVTGKAMIVLFQLVHHQQGWVM